MKYSRKACRTVSGKRKYPIRVEHTCYPRNLGGWSRRIKKTKQNRRVTGDTAPVKRPAGVKSPLPKYK